MAKDIFSPSGEDTTDEIPDEQFDTPVGSAPPANPLDEARKPTRRKAIIAGAIAVGCVGIAALALTSGGDSAPKKTAPSSGASNFGAAKDGNAPIVLPNGDTSSLASLPDSIKNSTVTPPDAAADLDEVQRALIDSTAARVRAQEQAKQPKGPGTGTDRAGTAPSTDPALQPLPPGSPLPTPGVAAPDAGVEVASKGWAAPTLTDPKFGIVEQGRQDSARTAREELERQRVAERERRAEERQRRIAEKRVADSARIATLEKALEGSTSMLEVPVPAGEVALPGGSPSGNGNLLPGGNFGTLGVGREWNGGMARNDSIAPFAKVPAVITTMYSSNYPGTGRVEAVLSAPLRLKTGKVLLPAGTKAYGTVSASVGSPDEGTYGTIIVTNYVTPSGQVIRGLESATYDPERMTRQIKLNVNRKTAERIFKQSLSATVDLAIASQSKQRNSGSLGDLVIQPSVFDQAVQQARVTAGNVLRETVGLGQLRPEAVIKPNTRVLLVFNEL